MSRNTAGAPRAIRINNSTVQLSNLEKELYPSFGFTKAGILGYYTRVAPYILPCLRGRAITLKRYPNGVEEGYFFEKRCPAHPAWVKTAEIPYGAKERLTACLVDDLQTLMWVENLASIELHVPLAKASSPASPDSVVFDLDPGENAGVIECARVAVTLKDMFDRLKLSSWIKTSGKKGLHVYIPLDPVATDFNATKKFSRAIAYLMQKKYPATVTAKMDKAYRRGKVFINWSQNDASKTMVCAYSLRADKKPAVSFPLKWDELKKLLKQGSAGEFQVLYPEAVARLKKNGDILKNILGKRQRLP